jgi:hypothetical protein
MLESLKVGMTSSASRKVCRSLGTGRFRYVPLRPAARLAADGDPWTEDTARVAHLKLGSGTRLCRAAVNKVDVGKFVEVTSGASDKESGGDAGPSLAYRQLRLVWAMLVDPLCKVGPSPPAVLQFKLVNTVDW